MILPGEKFSIAYSYTLAFIQFVLPDMVELWFIAKQWRIPYQQKRRNVLCRITVTSALRRTVTSRLLCVS